MNDNEYKNTPAETEEHYEPELFSSQENDDAGQKTDTGNPIPVPEPEETPAGAEPVNHSSAAQQEKSASFSRSETQWGQMDFSALPRTSHFANAEMGVYQSARRISGTQNAQEEEIPVCTIPLEKRNQLFSQPHVDLSQLPPPQSENVVTQRISDKVLKKQALIFSEKSPLPTRGGKPVEQDKDDRKEDDIAIQNVVKSVSLDPRLMDDENVSLGTLLKTARQQAGYTEEQVSGITKISLMYICNIEKDHIDPELPYIFLSAYIQSMCKLYKLDPDGTAAVTARLKPYLNQENRDIPVKFIEDLEQDALVNEEEEQRIRKYIYAGIAVISIFVLLLIWAIISALFPGEKQPEVNEDSSTVANEEQIPLPVQNLENPKEPQNKDKIYFDEKNLRQLNAPQFPEASSLELNQKPAIRQKN